MAGNGWQLKRIEDVADVIGGGTPSTKVPENYGGDVPWITPKDLSAHRGRYVRRGERNITEQGLSTSSAHMLPQGTVLVSSRAPVGYVAVAKNPVSTNQGFRSLLLRDGNVPEFFYYLLSASTALLESHANGTTFKEISGSSLKRIELLVPPPEEQKAIAVVLGSLDDKIELNRRTNETLEEMARALFKSWFVDFDPVRAKMEGRQPSGMDGDTAAHFPDSFEDSALGEIPKGWSVMPIGEAVKAVGGGTPSTKEPTFWDGGTHCWATPKDLSKLRDSVLLDTERKVTDAGLAKISSGLLPIGAVLLSSRAPVGYLAITQVPAAVNQGFIAMICDGPLTNHYVLHWARVNVEQMKGRASGTTFQEISKKNFRPMLVLVPPREILSAFDAQVTPLYDKTSANLRQSRTLAAIRDALLPKLLSGEVRVREAEQAVEGAL